MSKKKIAAVVGLVVAIICCCLVLALLIYNCSECFSTYEFLKERGLEESYEKVKAIWISAIILQFIVLLVMSFGVWYLINSELTNIEKRQAAKDKRAEQRKQAKIDKLKRKLDEVNSKI